MTMMLAMMMTKRLLVRRMYVHTIDVFVAMVLKTAHSYDEECRQQLNPLVSYRCENISELNQGRLTVGTEY